MRILLTTLNTKFIHSNLALRYLKAYNESQFSNIQVKEFSINDTMGRIIGSIFMESPDIIGISCYIWNIDMVLKIVNTLKSVLPNCKVVLGGPEVSYDGKQVIMDCPDIDYIVYGEGEETFNELLIALHTETSLSSIKGLIYRDGKQVIVNPPRPLIWDLDRIPFVYSNELRSLKDKIIYYETSRGCPFNCQYCLSSTVKETRFWSLDRVRQELKFLVESGVKQVKLVDRTFNCNPERAKAIFKEIIELGGTTNFHFEMSGDQMDEEMLEILNAAPVGMFQVEIGVQTTNPKTLAAVQRKTNFAKLMHNVKRILSPQNIHVHLDLIAGLPKEDYHSFRKSFNDVYRLSAHKIQLGFLKLLKGSGIRENASSQGYIFTRYPPYEVLHNDWMSYSDILRLKDIEVLVNRYYNTHRFDFSLKYLISSCGNDPFAFFEQFMIYWRKNQYFSISHSQIRLYEIVFEFAEELKHVNQDLLAELLRFDFCLQEKPARYPKGMTPPENPEFHQAVQNFFRDEGNILRYIPHLKNRTVKQIMRLCQVELFQYNVASREEEEEHKKEPTVILIDYSFPKKNVVQRSQFHIIRLSPDLS